MSGQVSQMFEQSLDAVKGWFDLSALDKSAPLEASLQTDTTAVPAGRVVSLNTTGEFVLGLANGHAMPIFLWNGKDHPDVLNPGTSPTTSTTHWVAISPTGVMSGLVATGGYELQTTEFVAGTYLPNQLLSVNAAGEVRNTTNTPYTNAIVGVTSFHVQGEVEAAAATGPVGNNAHGVQTLTFWPVYLPATSA
jgi:hypothetical protein